MQKIIPNLWFDTQAEEAANLYVALFKNSKVGKISRYGKGGAEISGQKEGTAMTVEFELDGEQFVGLNGGPLFTFTEAVSFIINCTDQEEVDHFWNGLIAGGGAESKCGWLKDKFGVSWQVVPQQLGELMSDPDPKKAEAVMSAMLKMQKLDVALLQAAYDQA